MVPPRTVRTKVTWPRPLVAVRLPKIAFFFRFFDYDGGPYEFADGTGKFHADYIAGWNSTFLQRILNECDTESDRDQCAAVSFTYRFGVFFDGSGDTDLGFVNALASIAVPFANTTCITTETIDGIVDLPRGTCNGTLISADGVCDGPNPTDPAPTPKPTTPAPVTQPTMTSPVITTTTQAVTTAATTTPETTTKATTTQETTNKATTTQGPEECIERSDSCELGDTCCDGECVNGVCDENIFCVDPGDDCEEDVDCCEGECIDDVCEEFQSPDCVELDEECEDDFDCCDGDCINGLCEEIGGNDCVELDEDCEDDFDCCDGECIDDTCQEVDGTDCVDLDEECEDDIDCCEGECIDGFCEEVF